MKLERISDNQIRCMLNRADLEERQLNLRELAYGTDKARMLFREMMQRAMEELGFSPDNMPLVIEAVPMLGEGIMLIITRVEDPEELDTRFARFSPALMESSGSLKSLDSPRGRMSAEDVLKAIGNILGVSGKDDGTVSEQSVSEAEPSPDTDISRTFIFHNIDELYSAAKVLAPLYHGANSLYRKPDTGNYYLVLHKSSHTPEEFNKICNIITEYGAQVKAGFSSEGYYREHYECILDGSAVSSII